MAVARVTFKKIGRVFKPKPSFDVNRGGRRVACIDFSTQAGRYYWYRIGRGVDDPVHNTLCIGGSATTLDGCKREIRDFFAKKDQN